MQLVMLRSIPMLDVSDFFDEIHCYGKFRQALRNIFAAALAVMISHGIWMISQRIPRKVDSLFSNTGQNGRQAPKHIGAAYPDQAMRTRGWSVLPESIVIVKAYSYSRYRRCAV